MKVRYEKVLSLLLTFLESNFPTTFLKKVKEFSKDTLDFRVIFVAIN